MSDSPLSRSPAGASSSSGTGNPSTGSLRTKISLKAHGQGAVTPSYTVVSPFYCMKTEVPPKSSVLGSSDLLGAYDLSSVYSRFCSSKRMREDLTSFLPHIYGNFNFTQGQESSSLRALYEKPPITGKEISNVSPNHMAAFRLNVGPVDERFRYLFDKRPESESGPALEGERRDGPIGRYKHSLDRLEEEEIERKRHKAERKEKKRSKKSKKKDKK